MNSDDPSPVEHFSGGVFFLLGPILTPVGKHHCKSYCEKPASELKPKWIWFGWDLFFLRAETEENLVASLVNKKKQRGERKRQTKPNFVFPYDDGGGGKGNSTLQTKEAQGEL